MKDEKTIVAETIWMHYFNRYLFEHGLITEEMKNRVAIKINSRNKVQRKSQ